MVKNWMKSAFENAHGQLKRMLGIPKKHTIPKVWLKVLVKTRIGSVAKNPTTIGHKYVLVTKLLKERAIPLLNADNIRDRRK
jgi:hypothetical protein